MKELQPGVAPLSREAQHHLASHGLSHTHTQKSNRQTQQLQINLKQKAVLKRDGREVCLNLERMKTDPVCLELGFDCAQNETPDQVFKGLCS